MARNTFEIKGLKRWRAAIDARGFDEEARAQIRIATTLNGKVGEALQRKTIQEGNFKKNAALTIALKHSTKPLVASGGLFQSITSRVIDDFTVFIGVIRASGAYNVAVIVHDGLKIKITDRMRGLFFNLWRASTGSLDSSKLTGRAAELWAQMPGGWLPLSRGSRIISIPARPWAKRAMRGLVPIARKNWKQALDKTFSKRANAERG